MSCAGLCFVWIENGSNVRVTDLCTKVVLDNLHDHDLTIVIREGQTRRWKVGTQFYDDQPRLHSLPFCFASLPHFNRPTYLMCPPEFYDVNYVINPWMAGNLHQPSRDTAFMQWKNLYRQLQRVADVRLLHAREGSPDMVFVAHAAVVQHGVAAVSSFTHPQRQTEERHLRKWLQDAGFLLWDTPRETSFEGEGDALLMPMAGIYGLRMGLGRAGIAIGMWPMPGIRR